VTGTLISEAVKRSFLEILWRTEDFFEDSHWLVGRATKGAGCESGGGWDVVIFGKLRTRHAERA
jgi:hypothetical protein